VVSSSSRVRSRVATEASVWCRRRERPDHAVQIHSEMAPIGAMLPIVHWSGGPYNRRVPRGTALTTARAERSFHEDPEEVTSSISAVVEVELTSLKAGLMVRSSGIDRRHVERLAHVADRWPPVLVAARSLAVIDGVHRIAAARMLGRTTIVATMFDGDHVAAYAEAVGRNVRHGLPLTLDERRRAARELLLRLPERSDRSLAGLCGLDHKTIARLRHEVAGSDARPGTLRPAGRPAGGSELRARIAAAIAEHPDASLRRIAVRVGASPETVRSVRKELASGEVRMGPSLPAREVDPRRVDVDSQPHPVSSASEPSSAWMSDAAFADEPRRIAFARWFDDASAAGSWALHVPHVPLSRVYDVAAQARSYADAWRRFADALELRALVEGSAPQ